MSKKTQPPSESPDEEKQPESKQSAPQEEKNKEENAGFDEVAESEMMRRLRDLGYVE